MSRASNDITAVRMVLGPGIMYPAETLIITIGALAFMFSISWQLTLIALTVMPVVSILVKRFGSIIHKRFQAIQEKMSDISALAQENLSGMRVVKAYAQEDPERAKFATENDEYFNRNMRLVKVWGAFYPMLASLIGLGTALVLWWGGAHGRGDPDIAWRVCRVFRVFEPSHLAHDRARLGGQHLPARGGRR